MIFTWKLTGILVLAALSVGAIGGAQATFMWYKVGTLKGDIKYLKLDRARYRKLLGFNAGLDDNEAKLEITNDELAKALLAKKAPEHSCDAGNLLLIDPEWLRELGQLR